MDGKWLSILEYAAYKKKSISTVRRYIKANRVKHREENGKYFIWCKNFKADQSDQAMTEIKLENSRLKKELRILKEERDELKMLVTIYEQTQQPKVELPELPSVL